jgi:hypothetical protein
MKKRKWITKDLIHMFRQERKAKSLKQRRYKQSGGEFKSGFGQRLHPNFVDVFVYRA